MNRRDFLLFSASSAATLPLMADGLAAPSAIDDEILVSFGLVTDVQYADVDIEGERDYRASLTKLDAAVAALSSLHLPFTVHLGDLIDRDWNSFEPVLASLKRLGHPVQHVLGNHDFSVADANKARVPELLGIPLGYREIQHAGVRWLILDTSEISTYRHPAGSRDSAMAADTMERLKSTRAENAKPWNGGISETQLAWLDGRLAEADHAHDPVLICGHHPLISESGHQAWNAPQILATLAKHPSARAYLCGHQHAGGEAIFNGRPMIIFKSLLHLPDVTSWSVLRLGRRFLHIDGHGRELSRALPLPDWP